MLCTFNLHNSLEKAKGYFAYNDYNYSGYGSVDDVFDEFDDDISNVEPVSIDIYHELLSILEIDHNVMNLILNNITRFQNKEFKFIRISSDYSIVFVEDENSHVYSIPLEKIIKAKNYLFSQQGTVI